MILCVVTELDWYGPWPRGSSQLASSPKVPLSELFTGSGRALLHPNPLPSLLRRIEQQYFRDLACAAQKRALGCRSAGFQRRAGQCVRTVSFLANPV
jgi:hypothetical protein